MGSENHSECRVIFHKGILRTAEIEEKDGLGEWCDIGEWLETEVADTIWRETDIGFAENPWMLAAAIRAGLELVAGEVKTGGELSRRLRREASDAEIAAQSRRLRKLTREKERLNKDLQNELPPDMFGLLSQTPTPDSHETPRVRILRAQIEELDAEINACKKRITRCADIFGTEYFYKEGEHDHR